MMSRLLLAGCLLLLVVSGVMLWSSRHPLIVDDVYPGNACPELLEKADILYIIPFKDNTSIAREMEWCSTVTSLNKTLGLHGIRHTYHEFAGKISDEALQEAILAFKNCFGSRPSLFRPPYNLISSENRERVEKLNMTMYATPFFLHPYCHCNPQSWMRLLNGMIGC